MNNQLDKYDIFLAGVGGQGILTIADMLMRAAEAQHIPANYFPTKGMAQRGGFVKAQLKLGRETVGPDIRPGGADLVIAMELSESLKALRYLRRGGHFAVYGYQWQPTEVMLGKAAYPTVEQVREQAEACRVQMIYLDPAQLPPGAADNIWLLAACLQQTPLGQMLPAAAVKEAILKRWPKGAERNMRSFEAGLQL